MAGSRLVRRPRKQPQSHCRRGPDAAYREAISKRTQGWGRHSRTESGEGRVGRKTLGWGAPKMAKMSVELVSKEVVPA